MILDGLKISCVCAWHVQRGFTNEEKIFSKNNIYSFIKFNIKFSIMFFKRILK